MRQLLPALLAALAALLVSTAPQATAQQVTATPPRSGVVCTTSASGGFELTATIGSALMSDGNAIFMWGYAPGAPGVDGQNRDAFDRFQYPGPVLCVEQGQTVTITLHNMLLESTSLIFPGQADVLAGGQPSQPQLGGAGAVSSLAQTASAATTLGVAGGTQSYSFVAGQPGTYLYQSGTNPGVQVQMGLFGVIIVRPSNPGFGYSFNPAVNHEGQVAYSYNRADSSYNPAHEHIELLSEIDPFMHQAYERYVTNGGTGAYPPFDMQSYQARYFLINGRTFPDTMADNGAPWLPNQPYSALVHIYPYDAATNPNPALVRYVGVGTQDFPFHPHGNHSRVIGRDGQPVVDAGGADLSYDKFSVPVGPGQTWDVTFDWRNIDGYSSSSPIPVTVPQQQNLSVGPYWSGSPYLGNDGPLPAGGENYSQCGEYYHIAHNHALQQMTSWGGITLSGQAAYTRIDPPLPNSCP